MPKAWTEQEIAQLSTAEIETLRDNAQTRGASDVVAMCEDALNRPRARSSGTRAAPSKIRAPRQKVSISDPATVARVADLLLSLPQVATVNNGTHRLALQASPIRTLGELWTLFIVCGFSTQEDSSNSGRLARFFASQSPLLKLDEVSRNISRQNWVLSLINEGKLGRPNMKSMLVTGNFPHFQSAGTESTLLTSLANTTSPLAVFGELARGGVLSHADRKLAASKAFSETLVHDKLPQIGSKQLRNILVNSGLAHNVVPLDSRWQGYLAPALNKGAELAGNNYLEFEDLLRLALLQVQPKRPDLCNLAVLDAVVFALQDAAVISGGKPGVWHGAPAANAGIGTPAATLANPTAAAA